jgi:hypothetical protein
MAIALNVIELQATTGCRQASWHNLQDNKSRIIIGACAYKFLALRGFVP